jgi:hypothetical protein
MCFVWFAPVAVITSVLLYFWNEVNQVNALLEIVCVRPCGQCPELYDEFRLVDLRLTKPKERGLLEDLRIVEKIILKQNFHE